jgi:phage terminase large subunit-like protein
MAIPPITEWAEGPYGFYVDRRWDAKRQRWHREKGPIVLAEHHRRVLAHCFQLDEDGQLPYHTVCLAESAKSGKTAIAALVHLWFALHIEAPSEQYVISNKQDQAQSRTFKALAEAVRWNPHLRRKPTRYELTFANGTTVKAIPCNYRGESGARFTLASIDEPWGVVHEDGVRLIAEFKPDPTRTACCRLFTGYGGYVNESQLWADLLALGLAGQPVPGLEDIEDGRGAPACWQNEGVFVFWSHWPKQPWQTARWIQQQRQTLRPPEFARLIAVDHAEGQGNFVDPAAWAACIDPAHMPLEPTRAVQVYIGLDLAIAPGGDDAALVAVYRGDDGAVKLAFHNVWRGKDRKVPLKLGGTVKPFLLRMAQLYDVAGIFADAWQGKHLLDELQAEGLRIVEVPQTHSGRGPKDTALFELIANRRLVLYDHPDVRTAAQFADAKELGNGLVFLTKSKRGKIDLLVALSLCANEAAAEPMWLIY